MLKVNFCMRKRPDRTLNEFSNYWREQHGPFAMSGRTARLGMRRYVQNHRVVTPLSQDLADLVGRSIAPFEGICQLWFDGEDAVLKTRASADGVTATKDLVEDERNFLDLPNCDIRFCQEEACISGVAGSGAHKVVLAGSLKDASGITFLGRQISSLLLELRAGISVVRAVQNFGLETPANQKLRLPRGNSRKGLDYILELWFADYASLSAGVLSQDGIMARVVPHLRASCENEEMAAWIAEERIMIGGEQVGSVAT